MQSPNSPKPFLSAIFLSALLIACGNQGDETQSSARQTAFETKEETSMSSEDYKASNLAYLEENKAKEGVTVTETGLQYTVEAAGDGKSPTAEDYVLVHYAGRLVDGTEFDSSYKRGEPAMFPAGRLIPGWTEALQLMQEGAKWQLVIPAEIAYGDVDRGPIPADSTLIFDVELLEVHTTEELVEGMKAPQIEYLEQNKTKEGVQVTESGLQYKVLESGDGASPADTDTVTVHYSGRLIDGTEFDSSYKRGEPAQFPVNGVIAGWTEALQLMKEGDKWELTIPYEIAYGARGSGQSIPPYATLVFDVELIKVN